jgi:hypothetical protein
VLQPVVRFCRFDRFDRSDREETVTTSGGSGAIVGVASSSSRAMVRLVIGADTRSGGRSVAIVHAEVVRSHRRL